jgi:hypothetical protein
MHLFLLDVIILITFVRRVRLKKRFLTIHLCLQKVNMKCSGRWIIADNNNVSHYSSLRLPTLVNISRLCLCRY